MGILRHDGCNPHLPERASEDEEELTGWTKYSFSTMSELLFPQGSRSCDVQLHSFGHSQPSILQQLGGSSPFSHSQAGQKTGTSSPVEHMTGQQERGPGSFSLLQANGPERKERKKRYPQGGFAAFTEQERLDYNPRYVFISALLTRCCSPWLSCLLPTAARFTISSPGKPLPPCKANP